MPVLLHGPNLTTLEKTVDIGDIEPASLMVFLNMFPINAATRKAQKCGAPHCGASAADSGCLKGARRQCACMGLRPSACTGLKRVPAHGDLSAGGGMGCIRRHASAAASTYLELRSALL